MHLPPSLGMGFGNDSVVQMPMSMSPAAARTHHSGVGLGLMLGSGQVGSAMTSSALTASAAPWYRGHAAQQNSSSSTSSGQVSGVTELGGASLRRLSTGSAFFLNAGNGNGVVGAGASGMGIGLPPPGDGLEMGQMVKLSPTGRTTIPVGQSDV
ncbi:hypothetical protein KEM56_003002, partial [Ascosphaera pollenicola]